MDKRKGGSFRAATGEVLPNLGTTNLEGVGTLSGSLMKIGTQVAETTRQRASVHEVVTDGMMVVMHRSGEIAESLDNLTDRKSRDLVKGA